MNRGYSWEEQRCSQASIFDPLGSSSKHARCYEHVVSVERFTRVRNLAMLGGAVEPSSSSGMTYKTLDPAPYWPETGHAQITCRPSSAGIVVLPADAREADKMLR